MKNEWYSKDEVGILLKRKDDEYKWELETRESLRNVEKHQDYSIHKRQLELKDKEIEILNKRYLYCMASAFVLIGLLILAILIILGY